MVDSVLEYFSTDCQLAGGSEGFKGDREDTRSRSKTQSIQGYYEYHEHKGTLLYIVIYT